MGRYLVWVVLGVIAAAVLYLAFNAVRREARPLVKSATELEQMERGALSPLDMVVVTMDDHYHRKGCPEIQGTREEMTLAMARQRDLEPCPVCNPEGGQP